MGSQATQTWPSLATNIGHLAGTLNTSSLVKVIWGKGAWVLTNEVGSSEHRIFKDVQKSFTISDHKIWKRSIQSSFLFLFSCFLTLVFYHFFLKSVEVTCWVSTSYSILTTNTFHNYYERMSDHPRSHILPCLSLLMLIACWKFPCEGADVDSSLQRRDNQWW